MMRSGLEGMLTSPFRPSTSRGQPRLVGSTIPRTPSSDLVAGSGVGVGTVLGVGTGFGAAVGATVGTAVSAAAGAVGFADSDEHAANVNASRTARGTIRVRSCRMVTMTPVKMPALKASRPDACF